MNYFTTRSLISKKLFFISTLLFLVLIVTGCSTTPSVEQRDLNTEPVKPVFSIDELMQLASVEENKNQWEKAIFYYIQVVALDGSKVDIFAKIGDLHNRLQNPDMAMRAYSKALALNPDYIPALAQKGIYALEHKNVNQARKLLKQAISLDQQRLGSNNINTRFTTVDQSSPLLAYNVYAVINDLDGDHDQARKIYALLLKEQETSALIYTNLGYSYYLTNNYALAQGFYKKALDLEPSFERAKLNLGLIYIRNGQYSRAVQLFKQVMTDAQAYNDIGYFLMLDGRYKEAEYFLQSAVDLAPAYYETGNINLENVQLYLSSAQEPLNMP